MKAFISNSTNELMLFGLFYGVLLITVIYLLILYRSLRKKYLLFYISFIVFYMLAQVYEHGLGFQYLWPNNTWVEKNMIYLVMILVIYFLTVFTTSFLKTKEHLSTQHHLLIWISRISAAFALLLFIVGQFDSPHLANFSILLNNCFNFFFRFVLSISFLTIGYLSLKKERQNALYYVIALSVFYIAVIISGLKYIGWIEKSFLTSYAIELGTLIQIFIFSLNFIQQIYLLQIEKEKAWQEVKAARVKLEHWKNSLEATVVERTASIKNLLDYADQGFISINNHLMILDEYSTLCSSLFGYDISGHHFCTVLGLDFETSAYVEDVFIKIKLNPFSKKASLYLTLLPDEIEINQHVLQLNYKVIYDINTPDEGVLMVIINDITEKHALEQEIELQNNHFEQIVKVVTHNDDFNDCVRSYRVFYRHTIAALLSSNLPLSHLKIEFLRNIHALKGNFSLFEMQRLVSKLHLLEDELIALDCENSNTTTHDLSLLLDRQKIKDWLNNELDHFEQILGKRLIQTNESISVPVKRIRDLEEKAPLALIPKIMQLRCEPICTLLDAYPEYVTTLAHQHGKKVNPLALSITSIIVDKEDYIGFTHSLLHIFKNMIVNNIESSSSRIQSGKSEFGSITCSIDAKNDQIFVVITDDGLGMDVSSALNPFELSLDFECVLLELEKLKGTYEINHQLNLGTTITFSLPYIKKAFIT